MSDPLAMPCDRCAKPCGADCLSVIITHENGYRDTRGMYCDAVCAKAAEDDGSAMDAPILPEPRVFARMLTFGTER